MKFFESSTGGNPVFTRRQLYELIWPLLVEQILTVFVGMVDVLMIAAVGEMAVSGVSLVDSINTLIINMLFALTAGGTVVCARYLGASDDKGAGRTCAQLVLLTLVFTITIMLVFLFGGNGVLNVMFGKAEEGVLLNASVYLKITALSYPFLALYNATAATFRAAGNTRISMLWSTIMNVINLAGNAFCIFVLNMGVAGVAIPTLIARMIGAVGLFYMLEHGKKAPYIRNLSELKPDGKILKSVLSIGVPNSVESGLFHFGKLTLQSLVSTLGTPSIAAYAVACNLVNFLYLPGNTLGAALLTIVGRCCGSGEAERAKDYTKLLIIVNYAMLAVVATTMAIGRGVLIGFYGLSAEASELARGLLLIHCIAMIIWPIAFLTPYYFRAIGKARFTMVASVAIMWIFRIGLAYVFIKLGHMNVLGAWYAMFVDWIARIVIFIPVFKRSHPV